ncbi:B12-binding domain-containing protein [Candidatus Hecatella orcuttiae]|jgi:trimethylamine corrinoid protein|uniref:cobalamin B12-binding domain-containing protein n=1 Tax=Candidatus Hecatella orcuttiae TaxID=1935119 RepID=UPI002867FA23|nr:B12-binding domain-containing protein [Candidatus Hecatella orcuttiae]
MAEKEEILRKLCAAIREGDVEATKAVVNKILESDIDALAAIDASTEEMRKIGEAFQKGELYLPHVMMAADALREAIVMLTPKLQAGKERKYLGKVVIATVLGDVHDLGKDIVAVMMEAAGFQVFNLGRDIPAKTIVDKAKEVNADIVGASALMTTTMPEQKTLAEELKKAGIRDKVVYMVGGAPVTADWVKVIGADARGEDAVDAVNKAKELLEKK